MTQRKSRRQLSTTSMLIAVVLAGFLVPAAARAGKKTCLTGTDPSVAADLGQIAEVRALVDATCACASFDGSAGKTHAKYVSCASSVIAAQAGAGQLRSQCKATVKKYYSTSTCGVLASKHMVPCVKKTAKGAVTCAVKAASKCVTVPSKYAQAACTGFDLCIDAADTDGDGIIGAADSGACSTCTTRFCDRGNGTITDKQTGLTWEKKDWAGGLHDNTTSYSWAGVCSDGLSRCQTNPAAATACSEATAGAPGCAECTTGSCLVYFGVATIWDWLVQLNASNFAGHGDWRIPTVGENGDAAELESIWDCQQSEYCFRAEFDSGCTPGCTVAECSCSGFPTLYWSATTSAVDPTYAHISSPLGNGAVGMEFSLPVRAVR